MNYFRSADFSDGVYLVGDIHGDSMVFLQVGLITETFGSEDVSDLDLVHWKKNHKALLIFLGDVVDSVRPNGPKDVLGPKNDQLIVQTIVRLQAEAQKEGGQVVFIVGNHELGRITNDISCHKFSHASNCTRQDNYKKQVTTWMIEQLQQLKSVSVCMVDNTLICHGGVPPGLKKTTVSAINRQYRDFLSAPQLLTDPTILLCHQLAWHRPTDYVAKDIQQISYMKKTACSLVVGHSPMSLPAQLEKSRVSIKRTEKNDVVCSQSCGLENQIVYLDFAMSRAFNTGLEPKKEEFCLLGVAQCRLDQCIS